jgi:hypothetical protein
MLDLRFGTLTVVKKADALGRDEPMVWTLFIEISLDTLNSHQFVVTTDPLKGKLKKAGKGDTVNIPTAVGRLQRPAQGMLMAGAVVFTFDNDLRTNAQIRAGYDAAAKELNDAILDHFANFGFAQIGEAERVEIQARLRKAVLGAFLEKSAVLTLVGGKAVGGAAYTRALAEPSIDEPIALTMRAKKDRAIYQVEGRLAFER